MYLLENFSIDATLALMSFSRPPLILNSMHVDVPDPILVHSWAVFPAVDINLNSPNKGLTDHSDSLSDVAVAGAVGNSTTPLPPGLMEEEAEELRCELSKV